MNDRKQFEDALNAMWRGDLGGKAQVAAIFDRIVGERDVLRREQDDWVRLGRTPGLDALRAERDAAVERAESGPGRKLPTSGGSAGEAETASGLVKQGEIPDPALMNLPWHVGEYDESEDAWWFHDASGNHIACAAKEISEFIVGQANAATEDFTCFECGGPIEKSARAEVTALTVELGVLKQACEAGFPQNVRDALTADNEIVAKKLGVERAYSESLTAQLAGLNETERLNGMQFSIDTLTADNEILRVAASTLSYGIHMNWGESFPKHLGLDVLDAALAPRATEAK